MRFDDVTFVGPPIDDAGLLADVPPALSAILHDTNGLVAFRGGLHIRGACTAPLWHSLRHAWLGPESIAARYSSVQASDVPFAEDAVGDQFLLRGEHVVRLLAESGELEELGVTLTAFLERACGDPVDYLSLQPLLQFEIEGGQLQPGQLLSVYPPFCTKESADGVSLRGIAALDRLAFLADFARKVARVADGERIRVVTTP
jgi:hypothetical protein